MDWVSTSRSFLGLDVLHGFTKTRTHEKGEKSVLLVWENLVILQALFNFYSVLEHSHERDEGNIFTREKVVYKLKARYS